MIVIEKDENYIIYKIPKNTLNETKTCAICGPLVKGKIGNKKENTKTFINTMEIKILAQINNGDRLCSSCRTAMTSRCQQKAVRLLRINRHQGFTQSIVGERDLIEALNMEEEIDLFLSHKLNKLANH